jgi:hypothetical protein
LNDEGVPTPSGEGSGQPRQCHGCANASNTSTHSA